MNLKKGVEIIIAKKSKVKDRNLVKIITAWLSTVGCTINASKILLQGLAVE